MKKALLLPALLLAGAAQAQTNALKVDIFQPIINTAALSFEHKLSESSSFQLGLSGTFGYKDGSFLDFESASTSGFAFTPEYRLYLSDKFSALQGFYVGPYFRYQYLNQTGTAEVFNSQTGMSTVSKYEASLNAFGLGVTVGRHWIFKERFSLDLFLGPGYSFSSVSSDDRAGVKITKNDFVGYFDDIDYNIRGGLTFGVAF